MMQIGFGVALTGEDGELYLVVGVDYISHAFNLVRIPAGMTAMDLGRRFRYAPTGTDRTRAVQIEAPYHPEFACRTAQV